MDELSEEDERKFQEIVRQLESSAGKPCNHCQKRLQSTDILYSNALGFKDFPRCLDCLCHGLKRERQELLEQLMQHIQRRPCLRKAYEVSCDKWNANSMEPRNFPSASKPPESEPEFDNLWDAGDLGCGDLVLLLKGKLKSLAAGAVLKVVATDPGAPEDIPAWCNMTRHKLVYFKHPQYFIQSKG